MVPPAVLGLHRLPVRRFIGDPETFPQSVRQEARTRRQSVRGRRRGRTCDGSIGKRSGGLSTAPPSHGRRGESRTPSPRWCSWKAEKQAENVIKEAVGVN